jgi:cytochrome b6-f complex iron-sulfur subunit
MLDRSRLAGITGMREDQKEEAMIVGMSAYVTVAGATPAPTCSGSPRAILVWGSQRRKAGAGRGWEPGGSRSRNAARRAGGRPRDPPDRAVPPTPNLITSHVFGVTFSLTPLLKSGYLAAGTPLVPFLHNLLMSEELTPYQVVPKTPLAGSAASDIREQGEMTRRSFPFVITAAWLALTAALGGLASVLGRFMFPNVLFEPVQKFKAGLPSDYSVGEVDERWKDKYGIWIVRTEEIVYALITVCTHLGCTPNWLPTQNKFKCPCHGSGYYKSGVNFEGPTPRPLERAKIFIDIADGQIVVDKSKQFHQERGEWTDPEAFIKL